MWLAYVDESGNKGYDGSKSYTLGCVVVSANRWPDTFDSFIAFRRFLKKQFGIGVRDEIKASYLIRGNGGLASLGMGEHKRNVVYRAHMRLAIKLGISVFAVVIDKELIYDKSRDPRDKAWEYLLQRLERLSTTSVTPVMLLHDEGEELLVRSFVRKIRRVNNPGSAFGPGSLKRPARLIIEDPVPRSSTHSYFIQLADLSAYAAYRRVYPPPQHKFAVCPETMWDELGDARRAATNILVGGRPFPGIVKWP